MFGTRRRQTIYLHSFGLFDPAQFIIPPLLKHRRELNQIRQLDRFEFDRIAADLEISSSELEELVRRGLHAADELPLLLKALEIEEAALERTHPLVLRDMERVCTLCRHKARSDMDLADGTSAEYFSSYCPKSLQSSSLRGRSAAPIPSCRPLSLSSS
jgi:hypothetical protein